MASCPMQAVSSSSLRRLVGHCNPDGDLEELDLSFANIDDGAVAAILYECPDLRRLRVCTSAGSLSTAGARSIVHACPDLEDLEVVCPSQSSNGSWDDAMVRCIADGLPQLRRLHLGGLGANARVTADAVHHLVQKLGDLEYIFMQVRPHHVTLQPDTL